MTLPPETRLGTVRIERRIGRGGMGARIPSLRSAGGGILAATAALPPHAGGEAHVVGPGGQP